jgi:HAD superfamily hydrolase (TIGR01509 family)
VPWRWTPERYRVLLRVSGGRERLMHDMSQRADAPATPGDRAHLAREVHALKNRFYADLVAAGELPLRPGVAELVAEAEAAGLQQGIVTTTSRRNVQALLAQHFGPQWAKVFSVQVCGEDVAHKKPDPEAYQRAVEALQLSPLQALAIEDSPSGAAAAAAAGVPCIVTRSHCFPDDTIEQAFGIGPGLHTRLGWRPLLSSPGSPSRAVTLADLESWYSAAETVSAVA